MDLLVLSIADGRIGMEHDHNEVVRHFEMNNYTSGVAPDERFMNIQDPAVWRYVIHIY